jgi:glycosyltransferase involved in cell wall biosynthesis
MPFTIYLNGRFLQQPVTGVQRYGRELLKTWDHMLSTGAIDGRRFDFQVLAPRGPIALPALDSIPVRQAGRLRGHLWTQFELPFLARGGLLFSPANVHPLLSLMRPCAVTVHDLAYRLYPEAYTLPFRALYAFTVPAAIRFARAIITVSASERAALATRYPASASRIYFVHHGAPHVDEVRASPADYSKNEPFVLWVGTLLRRKNPQAAIDALALLNREMHLPLVMVGASYRGIEDARLTVPHGAADAIRFADRVATFAELARMYRAATCLVFPSFYEGFGLPLLEAMALGCPVVASDIAALREVGADAVLYCDPNDSADLAAKVRMIATDAALRDSLRARGLARARDFSWEKCARQTLAVFERVLAPAPQRTSEVRGVPELERCD